MCCIGFSCIGDAQGVAADAPHHNTNAVLGEMLSLLPPELMHSRFVAHISPQADLPGENYCVFSQVESLRKNTIIFTWEHRRCEEKRERINPTSVTAL